MSLGKYRTPLYFKEKESYSTMLGGIFSILFILFMLLVGAFIFYLILTKDRYELSERAEKFKTFKESTDPNSAQTFVIDPACST